MGLYHFFSWLISLSEGSTFSVVVYIVVGPFMGIKISDPIPRGFGTRHHYLGLS